MILIKNPSDQMSYRVYVDGIDPSIDISSASFAATGLTFGSVTPDNTTSPKSVVVPISGGAHGTIYQATGTFILSAGGPLTRTITLRVMNS
jgi:hypothetical protein